MKKVLAIILAFVLVLQAGAITVFAGTREEEEQVITISNIGASLLEEGSAPSETEIVTQGISSDSIEILDEEWVCPEEIVFSGDDIDVLGGKYSYKLVLRSNGTMSFNNNLEIVYQGINGKYQLDYAIDETDNHIMVVSGTFDNIIIASPLMEKLSDKTKEWILSHISNDSYFYNLNLRTQDGFTFTNMLKFLFDSKEYGYSIDYIYDLAVDDNTLVISGMADSGPVPAASHSFLYPMSFDYNGTVQKPEVTVIDQKGAVIPEKDYKVIYADKESTNVGTYKMTVIFKGDKYVGLKTPLNYKIKPVANPIKVKATRKVSAAKLKKQKQTFNIAAKVEENAKTTYALKAAPKKIKKYISVSSAGKVTLRKGCPKGTYKIKVAITAAKTQNYKKTTAKKTIKIVIK